MASSENTQTEYQLTGQQCIWCRAAVLKHVGKTLTKLKEDAIAAGKGSLATAIQKEIGALQEDTVEKFIKAADLATGKAKVAVNLSLMETRALDAGLPKLMRDMKAAKGTVGSLGKQDWAKKLEAEATLISEQLVPQFTDNRDLFEDPEAKAE